MGYITKNWNGVKNSINLSQKFYLNLEFETGIAEEVAQPSIKLMYFSNSQA